MDKWNDMQMMSDWCIDDGMGWFVSCLTNILFKFDMQRRKLFVEAVIPTKKAGPFQNPYCVKYQNIIYCIPTYESKIWCYDLILKQWRAVDICNDVNISVMAAPLGKYKGAFYFFSAELKKIYGIDLEKGNVIYIYSVDVKEVDMHYCSHGILIENKIYFVFGGTAIYEFDLELQQQKKYDIPDLDDELFTLAFDGEYFWLIGKKAKVYVYDKKDDVLITIEDFPKGLLLYDFSKEMRIDDFGEDENGLCVFNDVCCLNGKIWLIAASLNKILYCGQTDRLVRKFEIQDEEENAQTLKLSYRKTNAKFRLLYIREKCYLGIYSYKNKRVFEINTLKMTYQNIDFVIDKCSFDKIPIDKISMKEFRDDGSEFTNLLFYANMINNGLSRTSVELQSVGEKIYKEIRKIY